MYQFLWSKIYWLIVDIVLVHCRRGIATEQESNNIGLVQIPYKQEIYVMAIFYNIHIIISKIFIRLIIYPAT